MKIIFILVVFIVSFSISGCRGNVVEEGFYAPDSPEAKAWRDERYGNDENLGPNSPGYIGPEGEYSIYPENDEH